MTLDTIVDYSYTTIYNFRPDEMYGMGKESLICNGRGTLGKFLEIIERNSSIKFEDAVYQFYGLDEHIDEYEPWVKWIGQPMYMIVDIKVTPVEA